MQAIVITLSRGLAVVARIALWISGTGLVLMTAAVAWQVFGRYVLNATPIWTEVTAVLLMGWFIFLGAAVGIREGYHLSFDILLFILPQRVKLILFTISDLLVGIFALGMTLYGIQLAQGTWSNTISGIGLPSGVAFFALLTGGGLIMIFSFERVARRLVGLPTARFGETELTED
jgi:TRAP-type C4-dicarboxylate transport system permease small subunit